MRPRRARWRHRLLLALVTLYSLFPIYFITVQSLKTPQEDVFGNPLWIAAPTFENYTELFEGGEARESVVGARSRSHYERVWAPWLSSTSATP